MSYTEFAPKPNPFSALAANNSDLRPALADLALAHTFAHDLGLRRSVSAAINWREQRNGHPPEVVNGITFRNAQIGEFARKIDTPEASQTCNSTSKKQVRCTFLSILAISLFKEKRKL